ncbi:MAG: hypothetical protein PHP01_04980 [Phycisphaerae bacterium]|nr:hypothetical protein [Phycisphaerae bacterium]
MNERIREMFRIYPKIAELIVIICICFSTASAVIDPCTEAQMLAIELEGQLRSNAELAEQIYSDLAVIRSTYPEVANITYRPQAAPNQLMVGLTQEAAAQYLNGQYHALDELNELYGVIEIETHFSSYSFLLLTFNQVYNIPLLAQIYIDAQPEGVRYVEGNGMIGDGSTIVAEMPFYIFIKKWGDCPSGCTGYECWSFKIEDGQAILWTPSYSGGSGTEADPYKIGKVSDWTDLMYAARDWWDKYFIMTEDLDLEGVAIKPVGFSYNSFQTAPFYGYFDGQGHIIRNADINMPTKDRIGLFGYVAGEISNLGIEDVNITGNNFVGGLAGENRSDITACYVTGKVKGNKFIGGLAGYIAAGPVITDSYASVTVTGNSYVGGLSGISSWGYVYKSYSAGPVDGNEYVGGLMGRNDGQVANSFWDIQTSGQTSSAGGEGKTTAEMKTLSTFSSAGWDFVEIWGIGEKQTYPYLRTESAGDLNHDKKVDFEDFAILASNWLEGTEP